MTTHRRIFLTAAIAAAVPAGMPALAVASPLLSGYGGPGQGSQAILGSTLIGGGSAGGSGGGSGGGGSAASEPLSSSSTFHYGERSAGAGASASGSGGGSEAKSAAGGGSGSQPRAAGRGSGSQRHSDKKSGGGKANADPVSSAGRADETAAVAPETAGLSGDDLLFVLLAFLVLIATGALTRLVARPGTQKTTAAKGASGTYRLSQ